jgi:hypothetical protein
MKKVIKPRKVKGEPKKEISGKIQITRRKTWFSDAMEKLDKEKK